MKKISERGSEKIKSGFLIFCLFLLLACQKNFQSSAQKGDLQTVKAVESSRVVEIGSPAVKKMLESAVEQTRVTKSYDPEYAVLAYPNGDVPIEKGVCTDVVVRAFRRAGVDLQKEVHEDMRANFAVYPKKWSLKSPDKNIDHRRVPNLATFFTRRGKSLPVTGEAKNYQPGDVVAWDLNGKGLTHIGLVSNAYNETTKRYLIIHNIGAGAQAEDVIFDWKITGHFRYF